MIELANFTDKYNTNLINYGIEDFLGLNSTKLENYYFQTVVLQEDNYHQDKYKENIPGDNSINKQQGINLVRGRIKIRINELHRDLTDEELPWQLPQYGFNNLFGQFQIPQRGSTILIKFLNGDINKPVYTPFITYKVRPYMNEKEVEETRIYDFLPLDITYKDWNSNNFGKDEDINYNHQRYSFRLPPQWTENDNIDFDKHDCDNIKHSYFNDWKTSREHVDEYPKQKVQSYTDIYEPDIREKERPRFSDKDDLLNEEKSKMKYALKSWGFLYEDQLNNRKKEGQHQDSDFNPDFFPNRHTQYRKYSPQDDEFMEQMDSIFYFQPNDRRTVQYSKFTNQWKIKSGEYEFRERFFQGGKNIESGGGVHNPSKQKQVWKDRDKRYAHNEIVRNLKISGSLTDQSFSDLQEQKFKERIIDNFPRSTEHETEEEYPKGGGLKESNGKNLWIDFGQIHNSKLDKADPNEFNDSFPVKDEDSPEKETKHKKLVTYPMTWNNVEYSQNHENSFDDFYRSENLLQLNPFTYKLEHEYLTKDLSKYIKKIKEQKYFEEKFEIDFRSQEDVSQGSTPRWDVKGENGYQKLKTGGNRGSVQFKKKTTQTTEDTINKGEEEVSGGTSVTQGDFLDFAIYREAMQFVHQPCRKNVDIWKFGSGEDGFDSGGSEENSVRTGPQKAIFGEQEDLHSDFSYDSNRNTQYKNKEYIYQTPEYNTKTYDTKVYNGNIHDDISKEIPYSSEVIEDTRQPKKGHNDSIETKYDTSFYGGVKQNNEWDRHIQWIRDLQIVRNPKIVQFGSDNYRKRWDLEHEYFEEWDKKIIYYDFVDKFRKYRREIVDEDLPKELESKKRQVEYETIIRFDVEHGNSDRESNESQEKKEQQLWLTKKQLWHEPGLEEKNKHYPLDRHQIYENEEFYDMYNDRTKFHKKLQNWYRNPNWEQIHSEEEFLYDYNMKEEFQRKIKTQGFWYRGTEYTGNCPEDPAPDEVKQYDGKFENRFDQKEHFVKQQSDEVVWYYIKQEEKDDKRRPHSRHQTYNRKDTKENKDFWLIQDKKETWKRTPEEKGETPYREHIQLKEEKHSMNLPEDYYSDYKKHYEFFYPKPKCNPCIHMEEWDKEQKHDMHDDFRESWHSIDKHFWYYTFPTDKKFEHSRYRRYEERKMSDLLHYWERNFIKETWYLDPPNARHQRYENNENYHIQGEYVHYNFHKEVFKKGELDFSKHKWQEHSIMKEDLYFIDDDKKTYDPDWLFRYYNLEEHKIKEKQWKIFDEYTDRAMNKYSIEHLSEDLDTYTKTNIVTFQREINDNRTYTCTTGDININKTYSQMMNYEHTANRTQMQEQTKTENITGTTLQKKFVTVTGSDAKHKVTVIGSGTCYIFMDNGEITLFSSKSINLTQSIAINLTQPIININGIVNMTGPLVVDTTITTPTVFSNVVGTVNGHP